MLRRVLIGNRGEIAIRIAKAAAGLQMGSVAVFAEQDAASLHTRAADHAVLLGAKGNTDAIAPYLDHDALIAAALANDCDCIHPGYGFLSENADFARACAAAGLTFVGPQASALSLFGDKTQARELAESLNIPIVSGSPTALADVRSALKVAADIGFPVMLKACAGGGGRGMRAVAGPDDLPSAFERCQSEAEAAFGSRAVFLEKIIPRPKHIEVQILADADGHTVHLYDRDCSLQVRHQKIIEIAPAPNLPDPLRQQMFDDAIKLARAAGYVNAGTVEFLVDPVSGNYYFIECNPRIQVEHTVTEQVTGLDLVEAQLRIAAGALLGDLGLHAQSDVPAATGFAVQARVVAQSPGRLVGYQEPSGSGVRVDACGYVGYAPASQYDPLLAKVITTSSSMRTLSSALARAQRALETFYIDGVTTNIDQLRAVLSHPVVGAGDARTTFVEETPELETLARSGSVASPTVELLSQTQHSGPRAVLPPDFPDLELTATERPVDCPMAGSVVEVLVQQGATVATGDTLLVISAMKMEAAVAAPCSGVVSNMQVLSVGQALGAGQVVAAIQPDAGSQQVEELPRAQTWKPILEEVAALHALALQRLGAGSQEPGVVRQRSRGKLTCRERIDLLLDAGTFRETGSMAGFASYDDEGTVAAFTPANHVGGWGQIDGRRAVVCADDFTSRGGHADGAIGQKSRHLDSLSIEMRIPSIRLLDGSSGGGSVATMVPKQADGDSNAKESTGAIQAGRPRVTGTGGSFLPGHLGSSMYAEQLSAVPVVNMLLGSVVGIGAAKAVLGHFSVMVRDISQLFVAGPPVVSHAMGYDISKEDLGGWHIHATNGSVDNLAESEEEAAAMTRTFLSYLPTSVYSAPPKLRPDPGDPSDRREEELLSIVPRQRNATFDMRKTIRLLADRESFFEIGKLWGTDQIVGFARFLGYPVGVIASDSRHLNGGALTADGCDKLKRHLDLCDLFHLPVLNLVDNPGFAVGLEHEIAGTIRKGGEWMIAFAQTQVPIFSVLIRRSFGVAGNNYATPRARPSPRVAWPAADVGGIPPEGGIEAAYKRQLAEADDPVALRAELNARIESARGPIGPLNRFELEEIIDPRDTRRYVCEWVETAYEAATQAARLVPRPLQFRP